MHGQTLPNVGWRLRAPETVRSPGPLPPPVFLRTRTFGIRANCASTGVSMQRRRRSWRTRDGGTGSPPTSQGRGGCGRRLSAASSWWKIGVRSSISAPEACAKAPVHFTCTPYEYEYFRAFATFVEGGRGGAERWSPLNGRLTGMSPFDADGPGSRKNGSAKVEERNRTSAEAQKQPVKGARSPAKNLADSPVLLASFWSWDSGCPALLDALKTVSRLLYLHPSTTKRGPRREPEATRWRTDAAR